MRNPYRLSDTTFTVYIGGKQYQTDRTNPSWAEIKKIINEEISFYSLDEENKRLIELMKPITAIENAIEDVQELSVRNGSVFYGDEKIHDALSKRLLDVMQEGIDIEPWKLFVQNLFANPQTYARAELYDFLEGSDLPLTSDGCFLAYKMVNGDYKDIRTRTMDNSIGKTVEMDRTKVNPDRYQTCSSGLHFCSKGYLGSYGGGVDTRVVMVKINPADVVSIPVDYNYAKGRTWKYEVVAEVTREEAPNIKWNAVYDYELDLDWDDQDDDEDDDICWCGDPNCRRRLR